MRCIFALVVALTMSVACSAPDKQVSNDPRGEVNGRSFEFVSTKPDGTEWTFRTRGNSLWVAVVNETRSDEIGTIELSSKEARTLWRLIELVDVGGRKRGKPDAKHGTVILRLREPGEDGDHELISVQVSRRTKDQDVIDLANYLIDLVATHKHVEAQF
ncbi:MAG: hypothetical protein IPL61_35180 [Myxococcales bacterium]|nr:hypothetical protein [Myxococcales bacterium]